MSYVKYEHAFHNFIFAVILATAGALQSFAHEDHAHPGGLHFSHPLITESPSPDTKIRLDYFFLNVDGEVEDEELGEEGEGPSRYKESTVNLELEYAFTRNISIEADIPYTFINPDEGQGNNVSHFNTIDIGVKLATFILEEYGILLGGGLEFGLPTGDDDKGIGSDNIFEIEPFLSFGWKYKILEVVSFLHLGIPVNQKGGQDEGNELGYNLSTLVHVTEWLELLLEFDGETVLNGEEEGESVLNIDPGVKFKPFKSQDLQVGFGAGFPVTHDEEFEVRLIASIFYHFPYK